MTNFSTRLIFLVKWFCSSGLKQFGKSQNYTVWLEKQWLVSFAWKVIVFNTEVRDELLEMGIDLKIKHSVSPVQSFFIKTLHGRANFFGKFFREMFYMGINDQIMQERKLMVKKFYKVESTSQVSFSSHWPWPGLLIYYLKS